MTRMNFDSHVVNPVLFTRWMWPWIWEGSEGLARYQEDIMYSVVENDETLVVAGNMLGKDFITAIIVLWFFMTRQPCRVVTTSADHPQLEAVLWGEIRRLIQTCRYKIDGPGGVVVQVPRADRETEAARIGIVNNHMYLKKVLPDGSVCGLSYVMGRVSKKGEGLLGHHVAATGDGIPRTLFVADEASGVDDASWDAADTWANRRLAIGNPYQCSNFFKRGVKAGDLAAKPIT